MKKIISQTRHAIDEFKMIKNGDKVCVGVSGGKDSLALLKTLSEIQKYGKIKFELCAMTIDLWNGTGDLSKIGNFCKELGIKHEIVKTDIQNIVFKERNEKNPCSLCAKMRRGSLNWNAKKLGYSVVALAHHADDFVETFLMSLLFEGRLSTFFPVTYLSETKVTVIRPFIFTRESDIKQIENSLPVFKNPCPIDKKTTREKMKNFLKEIEDKYPGSFEKIFSSLIHPERNNLLDKLNK